LNNRIDFNRKAEEILSFIDTYEVLSRKQLNKFFPSSDKIIDYLIKNKRLHKSADGIYISTNKHPRSDKALIASVNVLADLLEKVKIHSRAIAPAQVSFLTHGNDYYEIVYVGYGTESMVMALFETQLNAKRHLNDYTDFTKRMVIVEDKKQMERLQIPRTKRFALVQPDGSLSYFKTAGS